MRMVSHGRTKETLGRSRGCSPRFVVVGNPTALFVGVCVCVFLCVAFFLSFFFFSFFFLSFLYTVRIANRTCVQF